MTTYKHTKAESAKVEIEKQMEKVKVPQGESRQHRHTVVSVITCAHR